MGPDRNKHLRNIAIVLALAVAPLPEPDPQPEYVSTH